MKVLLIIAAIAVVLGFTVFVLRRTTDATKTEADKSPNPGEVSMIDSSQLLYSLPTICDRMAPLEAPTDTPGKRDLTFHEDDWRQIEFVPNADSGYISSKLAELRQFKIDHRSGPGWTNTFVRPDHPTDFNTLSLRITDLSSALSVQPGHLFIFQSWSAPMESVGKVSGGFSFQIDDNVSIYGFQRDGTVQSLGITIDASEDNSLDINKVSAALGRIHELADVNIVDWYQCTTIAPDSRSELKAWLQR